MSCGALRSHLCLRSCHTDVTPVYRACYRTGTARCSSETTCPPRSGSRARQGKPAVAPAMWEAQVYVKQKVATRVAIMGEQADKERHHRQDSHQDQVPPVQARMSSQQSESACCCCQSGNDQVGHRSVRGVQDPSQNDHCRHNTDNGQYGAERGNPAADGSVHRVLSAGRWRWIAHAGSLSTSGRYERWNPHGGVAVHVGVAVSPGWIT
jgi:hypothetical protein